MSCFLDMEFLYNFDFILNPRKNKLFCGKIGKTLQLVPSEQRNKNPFLFDAEDHDLPRCCEVFTKLKIVNEKGHKTEQTDIIVEPVKESQITYINSEIAE